jgi:hypothetical protein
MLGFRCSDEIEGLEMLGFEIDGFEIDGFEMLGFEIDGFEMLGFEIEGLEMLGFEIDGFEIEGFERLGLDRLGAWDSAPVPNAVTSCRNGSVGSAFRTRRLARPACTGSPPGPVISLTSSRIAAAGSADVAKMVWDAPERGPTSVSRASTGTSVASRGTSEARPEVGWLAIRRRNHRASPVAFWTSTTKVLTDAGSSIACNFSALDVCRDETVRPWVIVRCRRSGSHPRAQ